MLDIGLSIGVRRRHKDAGLGLNEDLQIIGDLDLLAARLFEIGVGAAGPLAGLNGLDRRGEGHVTGISHS